MFSLKFKPRTIRPRFSNKTAPPIYPPPSCKDCKWSIDSGNFCVLFKINRDDDFAFNAKKVRENSDLCGPDGIYFKPIKKEIN